jgi:hypothetical protein
MSKREEYLKSMHAALGRLQVKASLTKLELRDLRQELGTEYDRLCDHLRELSEAAEDRFEAMKKAFEGAWHAFRQRFEAARSRAGEEEDE